MLCGLKCIQAANHCHTKAFNSLILQAEGFAILEGTSAPLEAVTSKGMTAGDEEIAWEAVEDMPAHVASAPGDCL